MAGLCLVMTGECLRFNVDGFNVLYCKILGPLMRQSEISSRYNGVVYYLAGNPFLLSLSLFFSYITWVGCIIVLYLYPRDIAGLSIMYLSWTDPTASICGRLWGRYTPHYGHKSLAGSLGAWAVGTLVTYFFFGSWQYASNELLGKYPSSYTPTSSGFLWLFSMYGGAVAAFSEFMGEVLDLDDNLTIPVVSAFFLWVPLVGR
jgi:diacylglycerol kinase (CTP)